MHGTPLRKFVDEEAGQLPKRVVDIVAMTIHGFPPKPAAVLLIAAATVPRGTTRNLSHCFSDSASTQTGFVPSAFVTTSASLNENPPMDSMMLPLVWFMSASSRANFCGLP